MIDFPEYIITYRKNDFGETMYLVKWIGCDVDDNTWENEEKLLSEWPDALIKFNKELREKENSKPEELQTRPAFAPDQVFAYTESVTNWESEVDRIQYVEKSKVPGLVVYIDWKNGLKSVHHSTEVYAKCPQKMIEYYERHAKFREILADD